MKIIIKRLIAFSFAIVLVVAAAFGGMPTPSAVAAGPEALPSGLTELTFRDLGMDDGEYGSAQKTFNYSGSTLDNTVLSGKFTFKPHRNSATSIDNTIFYWGNILIRTNGETGLRVQFNGGSWTYLNDANLINQPVNMKLSIQYVNHDGGAEADDVKLGVWIDNVLYEDAYIYYDNAKASVEANKKLVVAPSGASGMDLVSVRKSLPTGLTELTFRDLGMDDGEYGSAQKTYTYNGTTLDNTVLSGKITFKPHRNSATSIDNTIFYWGNILIRTNGETGLRVQFNGGSWTYLNDANLINQPVNMKLSIQYVNHDGGAEADDVKLGVWIDNALYGDAYIYYNNAKATVEANKKLVVAPSGASRMEFESVSQQVVPEVLPSGLTEITLSGLGIQTGEYGSAQVSYPYSGTTLNNTVLSGKFTFKPSQNQAGNWENTILYWGNILIRTKDNGGLRVQFNGSAWTYLEDTDLINQPVNLKLSIQYVNHDGGTSENDVKLGIWIDDVLYGNKYIYYDNARDTVEANKKLLIAPSGASRIELEAEEAPTVPEVLPSGLTEITFQDLGIKNGEYGSTQVAYPYNGTTLNNTVLSGKFTFKPTQNQAGNWENTILYWGNILIRTKDNGGLRVQYNGSAWTYLEDASLVDQPVNLKLSIQYVNHDGGSEENDVKLGIWIDEVLYGNEYVYYDNARDTVEANKKLVIAPSGASRLILESENAMIEPEVFPTGLTNITFADLGMKDGEYGSAQVVYPYSETTLNNTVLGGIFRFKPTQNKEGNWENTILYWGNILIRTKNNEGLRVQFNGGNWTYLNDENLVNKPINMKLTLQYMNHDGGAAEDDVKLGIWIDDVLYGNEYIYYDNARDTVEANKEIKIAPSGASRIILGEEVLPERIQEITFSDFEGFQDGTYTNNSETQGKYQNGSMDGKVLTGTVTFASAESGDVLLSLGKTADQKQGLVLKTMVAAESGEKYLALCNVVDGNDTAQYEFYSKKAGTTLVGKRLKLQLSFQVVDNDLKLGVWFNGKLYNNEYILIDNYADTGNLQNPYLYATGLADGKIAIQSIKWETIPENLQEISFWDFCIDDRIFEKNASTTGEYYGESLDGTVFCGKLVFSEPGAKGSALIAVGSQDKYWNGLTLKAEATTEGEPYLRLYDAQKRTMLSEKRFYAEAAGTTLVGAELDLRMSFEFVNHDGGKSRNDLKLGMWFDGKLYKNEYIYICNYVDTDTTFGTFMTVYAPEGSSLKVQSVKTSTGPINYAVFGLTEDWESILLSKPVKLTIAKGGSKESNGVPNTSDYTATWLWGMLSLGSLLTCIAVVRSKRRS